MVVLGSEVEWLMYITRDLDICGISVTNFTMIRSSDTCSYVNIWNETRYQLLQNCFPIHL